MPRLRKDLSPMLILIQDHIDVDRILKKAGVCDTDSLALEVSLLEF